MVAASPKPPKPAVAPVSASLVLTNKFELLASEEVADVTTAEVRAELWSGDELAGHWFALISERNGKLLRLHGASAGTKLAWVPLADTAAPTKQSQLILIWLATQ